MKLLICDDNENAAAEINKMLDLYAAEHEYHFEKYVYTDSQSVIKCKTEFELAFIDIEMPKTNGLTLTKQLKERNPDIIVFIVTSFNRYLDDAMDLNVFRYLSKPVSKERLFKGLHTALRLYRQNSKAIAAECSDGCHTVRIQDILYFAIDKRKTRIVTENNEFFSNQSLDYWKKMLESESCFVQPHYSFIVNLANVSDFTRTEITVSRGKKTEVVPISRGHYNGFRKAFFSYMGVTV